jgi:hypothetical protein
MGLQIGHQQRGVDALAGDVGQHQSDLVAAQFEEVVIVSADAPGLETAAREFELDRGTLKRLRCEPRIQLVNFPKLPVTSLTSG